MNTNKYLDSSGITYLVTKLKELFQLKVTVASASVCEGIVEELTW